MKEEEEGVGGDGTGRGRGERRRELRHGVLRVVKEEELNRYTKVKYERRDSCKDWRGEEKKGKNGKFREFILGKRGKVKRVKWRGRKKNKVGQKNTAKNGIK